MCIFRGIFNITLLHLAIQAFGQTAAPANTDSLKQAFSLQPSPNEKVKTAYYISLQLYQSKPQEALVWCDTTIHLAERHGIRDVLPKIYSYKAKALNQLAKYDDALYCLRISIELSEKEKDEEQLVSSLLTQGAILSMMGRKQEALPIFSRAYDILKEKTDTSSMESRIRVAVNLGNALKNSRNFQRAIEVFQEGIEIARRMGETALLATLYSNLSLVYAEIKDYPAQRKLLWEAYRMMPKDNPYRAPILMSMASNFKFEQRADSALHYYLLALKGIGNDSLMLIPLCNGLSESYQLAKNYTAGSQWAGKALKLANKFNHRAEKARSLKNLGACLSGQGRRVEAEAYFVKALEQLPQDEMGMERSRLDVLDAQLKNRLPASDLPVYEAYRETFDTVFSQQKVNAIENARIEFETQLMEDSLKILSQANQIQQLELKRKRQNTRILGLLAVLLAAFAAGLYFYLTRRQQENEELKQLNLILKGDNKDLIEKIALLEANASKPASLFAFAEDMVVLNGNEKTVFKISDIIFIEAQGNGLQVTTREGKHWRWQRLRNVAEVLPNPPFIQTHRSYIVNGMHIKSIQAGKFQLSNGEAIPIGGVYQPRVNAFLKEWLPDVDRKFTE